MKYDFSEAYSDFYRKIRGDEYRREYLRFLRDKHPVSLARVMKDHNVTLEEFHVVI